MSVIVKKCIDVSRPLTKEQIQKPEFLKDQSIEFDDDCPELTEEELMQFKRVSDKSRRAVVGK